MATFAHAYAVKERMAARLLKQPQIHGVGVGYRDPRNPKRGAAIVIYAAKSSATALRVTPTFVVRNKKTWVGVPVRVVRIGKVRSHADYQGRIRPVPAGYSVGTAAGSGTVGLIVADSKRLYVFSNNHVLTNPINSRSRVETLQPGGADNGRPVIDRIGYLSRFALLKKNASNLIDAALSAPIRDSMLTARYPTVGMVPGYVTSYRVGTRFKKVGRTTGLRYGVVDSVNTDILVDYGGNLGTLKFRNQTVIRGNKPVSLPGDSGSVWLRRQDNFAASVNFAGTSDGRTSISFPIAWALKRFQVGVAQPSSTGRIQSVTCNSPSCSRQLTQAELRSIPVVQAQPIQTPKSEPRSQPRRVRRGRTHRASTRRA